MFGSKGLGFLLPFFGSGDVEIATTMPVQEAASPTPGVTGKVSDSGHAHPRLTSVHAGVTLDANGEATVTFNQAFQNEPAVDITGVKNGTMPTAFEYTLIQSNGLYTGCTVKGYKSQVVVVGVLGVNVNAFGGNPLGVKCSVIAIKQ